jgi:alkylation response protein AidB-like acyl-CoA dehydrogenase
VKFDLSDDQQLLRTSTVDFLATESPIAASRQISEAPGEGFSRTQWKKLAELGYLGLVCSERVGGQAMSAIELAIVCEELGKVCFPGPYLDVVLAALTLEASGKQRKALEEILAGESIVIAATADRVWPTDEPNVAFRDGRVTGTKVFVAFGAAADRLLVDTPQGVVLADGPFRSEPMETLDEAARFARVVLDNPAEPLGASELLGAQRSWAHVGAAADALGICQRSLEASLFYAKQRQTFGKPIGAYQVLQHRMADMLVRTESTRAAVYRAAWCLANRKPETALTAAAAKAYAVESACQITRDTVQLHGGNGFTWEYDIHRYLKRAITLEQHHGRSDEVLEDVLTAFEG